MARWARICIGVGAMGLAVAVAAEAAAPAGAVVKAPTLSTRHTSVGTVLRDSGGHTLYEFAKDSAKHSACSAACASAWPPALVAGSITVAGGVKKGLVTTIKRGAQKQLVYGGHPLYRFVGDTSPGQTHGEGLVEFGGKWLVLSASGKTISPAVKQASAALTPSPTPAPTYIYGY